MAFRLEYLPFPQIRAHTQVIVVDSSHPTAAITLSHWRGAPQYQEVHDDTSTGIVLNALQMDLPALKDGKWVTNNHWDIDGFLGVWALLNPEWALKEADLLRYMALVGDFRELNPQHPEHERGLALVCWLNAVERTQFYAPFDAPESPAQEAKASVDKYEYFLDQFGEVLTDPHAFTATWEVEYQQVMEDYRLLQTEGENRVFPESRLRVVNAPRPVHYYALFAHTDSVDLVATIYPDRRYEVEQKYSTWVDVAHRVSYPRVDMRPLAQLLTEMEPNGVRWIADAPFDTGPVLRPHTGELSKAARFDHPTERHHAESGIAENDFLEALTGYLAMKYQGVSPQVNWSWEETRAWLNQ